MEYEKVRKVCVCLGKRQNVHIIIIGSMSILLVKNSSPLFGLVFFFFFFSYLFIVFFLLLCRRGTVCCTRGSTTPGTLW